jgi:ribosomal protein S18 acetylase RimI-like enzyme
VNIRKATDRDRNVLRTLRDELQRELAKPPFFDEPWETVVEDVDDVIRDGVALIAEEDGSPIGYALASLVPQTPIRGHLFDLYVSPSARNRGVGRALIAEVSDEMRSEGASHLSLDVELTNEAARRLYERLGFSPYEVLMATPISDLERRLGGDVERPPSFASLHVQTDDKAGVERAVTQFMPRLGRSEWTEVRQTSTAWVTVVDELCNHDRSAQRRLGAELSERMGVPVVALALEEQTVVRYLLFERGRMVDEYLSVPTYYGELSKADELSLAANATLVARLTGAEPARVRAVVRTASSPSELPPAAELLTQIADVMGLKVRIEQ